MISKYFKIIFILLIFFFAQKANSKVEENNFNKTELSNYLSAIISLNNQQNEQSLKYFNSSKILIEKHKNYLKKFTFSLVANQKVKRAIQEIKILKNKKEADFFEAYVLLILDSITKKKYEDSEKYLNNLGKFKEMSAFENAIYDTLRIYLWTFKNKKLSSKKTSYENLNLLNNTFLKCYLNDSSTHVSFINLVNSSTVDYSRYLFFYANYLLSINKVNEAKKIFKDQDPLSSGILILQTKDWLNNNQIEKIKKIFSCKSENDLLAEFFFLISNLYSTQKDINNSNFYLNISNFLNKKFEANKLLTVDNYFSLKKFKKVKKILIDFDEEDKVFYWFKIKTNTKIIALKQNQDQALNYIESKYNKINNKTEKIIFDMANIYKNYKKYDEAILLYSKLIRTFNKDMEIYADLLFRRGGSNERLGNFKKSDEDLLLSLKILPNNSYTLNYLGYSWLERKINIPKAVEMLETAYKNNPDDPYITDSIGWGYYLIGRYEEAERLMRKAIILMPDDPIVNDHYGDILWSLNQKLQARYYWRSILNLNEADDSMRDRVKYKLIRGPKIEKTL